MAKKKAEPMWLRRSFIGYYLTLTQDNVHRIGITDAQAPVEVKPGKPSVRVWLVDEREHAMIETARMLVRSTKDGLDIVASGHYDKLVGLCKG